MATEDLTWLDEYSANNWTEIFLNARGQLISPSICWGLCACVGICLQYLSHSLKLWFNLHFLPVATSRSARGESLRPPQILPVNVHSLGCVNSLRHENSFRHMPELIDFQEYIRDFESPYGISSPSFCFQVFWLVYCLPLLLSSASGSHETQQWSVIAFW